MSDLQRSFAKAKLAGLPLEPALPAHALLAEAEHEAEETDELQPLPETDREEDATSASSASSASSTGTIGPNSKHLFARPTGFVYLSHAVQASVTVCNSHAL